MRLGAAVKVAVLVLFVGGACVGYVQQKKKLYELGRQIREHEERLDRLKWDNKLRAGQLGDLQLPQRIAERVQEQKLGLGPALQSRMVWLAEPGGSPGTNRPRAMLVLGQ